MNPAKDFIDSQRSFIVPGKDFEKILKGPIGLETKMSVILVKTGIQKKQGKTGFPIRSGMTIGRWE